MSAAGITSGRSNAPLVVGPTSGQKAALRHFTVQNPGSVGAGQTAAAYWSVPVAPGIELLRPPMIEAILAPGAGGRRGQRAGVRVRRWALPPGHISDSPEGIPLTDVVRTGIDMARGLSLPFALVSLDGALRHLVLRRGVPVGVARDMLAKRVEELRGGAGIAAVRRALPWVHPDAESALESIVRGRIVEARLPTPRLQVRVVGASGRHYRGDLGLDLPGDPPGSCRLIIEADGLGKYASAEDLAAEKRRQHDIERQGFAIERVLYVEGVYRPDDFLQRIRNRLSE